MPILNKIREIKKFLSPHKPLIEIFVYKQNLLNNFGAYQKNYPRLQFAPVLKANAYGHGLEQVLSVLKSEDLPFICVDSHFELRIAAKFAPKLQVLVIGFARLESIRQSDFNRTTFIISSFEHLAELSGKLKSPKRFHLKLDTGMHRQGILPGQYADAVELIKLNKNIILEGLCSHLADPDQENETLKQIQNWNSAVKYFKSHFPGIKYRHLSATGGLRYSSKIDANLARLGIGFYGIDFSILGSPSPSGERGRGVRVKLDLKPALEMRSIITGIKTINAEEKIGYGLTFTAKEKMTIATVPVGYFEGLDRRLGNRGFFKLGDDFCPIVGRLSMDIATIDVSANKKAAFGGEIVVISAQSSDKNSVENLARLCETLPYEILVHLPAHLKRSIV